MKKVKKFQEKELKSNSGLKKSEKIDNKVFKTN